MGRTSVLTWACGLLLSGQMNPTCSLSTSIHCSPLVSMRVGTRLSVRGWDDPRFLSLSDSQRRKEVLVAKAVTADGGGVFDYDLEEEARTKMVGIAGSVLSSCQYYVSLINSIGNPSG